MLRKYEAKKLFQLLRANSRAGTWEYIARDVKLIFPPLGRRKCQKIRLDKNLLNERFSATDKMGSRREVFITNCQIRRTQDSLYWENTLSEIESLNVLWTFFFCSGFWVQFISVCLWFEVFLSELDYLVSMSQYTHLLRWKEKLQKKSWKNKYVLQI